MAFTVSNKLAEKNSTGFDYLRIFLAVFVLFMHSLRVVNGDWMADAMANSHFHGIFNSILPAFFALSGFLVAGSLQRNNLITFAGLRIARIVPALAVEILLSALIIGPLFTELTVGGYFSAKEFYLYFLNILGIIHLELPGVFLHNPFPNIVNLSLWTIPYELECYLALGSLALIFRRSRILILLVTVLLCLVGVYKSVHLHGISYYYEPGTEHHFSGRALVVGFLCGVNIYLWRDKIPYWNWLGWGCLALGIFLASFYRLQHVAVIPLAYATVWIGLKNVPRSWVINNGDYSYGVYLFAAPIQQMLATYERLRLWWVNFLLALVCSVLYAAFSWHWVEHPVLKRKPQLTQFTNACNARLSSYLAKAIPWLRPAKDAPAQAGG